MVGYRDRAVLLLHEHTLQTSAVFGPTNHTPQYGATYHTPGYLVFLAGIFGLAGEHRLWVVYLIQSLLGIATLARHLPARRARCSHRRWVWWP